jgi:hypothetical protein
VSKPVGPLGDLLAGVSQTAFLAAMQSSLPAMAIIIAATAVLIGVWSPGRDGKQLRVIRALMSRP